MTDLLHGKVRQGIRKEIASKLDEYFDLCDQIVGDDDKARNEMAQKLDLSKKKQELLEFVKHAVGLYGGL